jgi:hypothetical protein
MQKRIFRSNQADHMTDFSLIISSIAAENACSDGRLIKVLLFPIELGGQDQVDNVVYIPPHAWDIKRQSTAELLVAVREGMTDVAVVPEYRGSSFVPTTLKVSATKPGLSMGYELEIKIW